MGGYSGYGCEHEHEREHRCGCGCGGSGILPALLLLYCFRGGGFFGCRCR